MLVHFLIFWVEIDHLIVVGLWVDDVFLDEGGVHGSFGGGVVDCSAVVGGFVVAVRMVMCLGVEG